MATNVDTSLFHRIATGEGFRSFLEIAQWALTGLTAIALITAIIGLVVNIMKFANSAGKDQQRSQAQHGIMVSLGCIAVLGSLGIILVGLITLGG